MAKTFKDLDILDTYSSDECDVLEEFYNPVLSIATKYDRVTGYFSPKVLAAAARGYAFAIKNNIKIRLLTSIEIDESLMQTIGNEFDINDFDNLVNWDVDDIEDGLTRDYLGIFSYLLKNNYLEMKVAVIPEHSGIFHQKVGILTDQEDNSLSFSGSNNETVYGWTENIEEFKVFKDWTIRSVSYFSGDKKNFEKLWNNESSKTKVLPISEAVKNRIAKTTEKNEDVNILIKNIKNSESRVVAKVNKKELRPYQIEAINSWFEHGCNAIFAMATGTGKTFTAINALKRFRKEKGHLHCVVAVPLQTLTVQWQLEIGDNFENCRVINTSTCAGWKKEVENLATLIDFGINKDYIIITTYNSIQRVANSLVQNDNILLADEVHNMITDAKLETAADGHFKYRLGLSATPMRIWKKEDSEDLARIFGNYSYEFGIDEALANHFLVPFDYYPHVVHCNDKEYIDYIDLSRKINKIRRRLGGTDISSKPKSDQEKELKESLKKMYEYRAYIKKNAEGKIPQLIDVLQKLKNDGQLYGALIYVDNEKMLITLQQALLKTNIITTKYVGETSLEERLKIIDALDNKRIDAIIAIKCLDEGVDIPSAKLCFILSNGTEPREYTQRLGRVLRRDKRSNKEFSIVNDYLVLPSRSTVFIDEEERKAARNLVKNELRRAWFFLKRARNADEVINGLLLKVDEYGFQFNEEEFADNANGKERN